MRPFPVCMNQQCTLWYSVCEIYLFPKAISQSIIGNWLISISDSSWQLFTLFPLYLQSLILRERLATGYKHSQVSFGNHQTTESSILTLLGTPFHPFLNSHHPSSLTHLLLTSQPTAILLPLHLNLPCQGHLYSTLQKHLSH